MSVHKYRRQRVLELINAIENLTGEMFHNSHDDLAQHHGNLMDNKNTTGHDWVKLISTLSKEVDYLNSNQSKGA